MFNAKMRKIAVEGFNVALERYKELESKVLKKSEDLFHLREEAVRLINKVEERINQLANSPKAFQVELGKIEVEVQSFKDKLQEIKQAEIEAKAAGGLAATGATLSTLGIAVASMGPAAAMGVATTFGVASTGTAISALSGAAAQSAALAWLGGGTLAMSGGGVAAGTAFMALLGPVGWAVAGVSLAASAGSGLFASHKNKEEAIKAIEEREKIEMLIREFNQMEAKVVALFEITQDQITGVQKGLAGVIGDDYCKFEDDEKVHAAILVNSSLTLAQMLNKEVSVGS